MPSPGTCFPKNVDDVVEFSRTTTYPCLLKAQFTYSPLYREGMSMVRVAGPDELVDQYRTMAALDSEIMIQEYIPGQDDQVYLYAGYFDLQAFRWRRSRGESSARLRSTSVPGHSASAGRTPISSSWRHRS